MQETCQRAILVCSLSLMCAAPFTAGPAFAVSTGCTAINGGALNLTVPALTISNGNVALQLDRGDVLTFTFTGNPNITTYNLLPSNTALDTGTPVATFTRTVNEDGVTGINFNVLAGGGGQTTVAVTCTPATGAATPASGGGGSDTPTPKQQSDTPTPEQQSDAADNAADAIDNGRLPTSPAALPGASDVTEPILSLEDPRYQELVQQASELRQLIAQLDESQKAIGRAITRWEDQFRPDGSRAGQPATEAERTVFGELWKEFHILQTDLHVNGNRLADVLERMSEIEESLSDIGDSEAILFSPGADGRSFTFAASTEALFRHAALQLDDNATGPASMPPLTIGGMPVNIWVRGRGTIFDRQKRAGSDGWAAHLLSGVALRVNDDLVLGAFGSYLTGESDQKATGTEVKTSQAGGGVYARLRVTGRLSAGLSASRETGEQDIKTRTATGTADTDLWTLSGSLSGSYMVAPVVLTPSLSVTYADSERDPYTDSAGTAIPGSRSQDTTVAGALTVSRSFVYEDGWIRRATPRLNATLNYFAREKDTLRLSATEVIDRADWGGNVGAGVTLLTKGSSRLSFDAGVIGIGQDTLGYTGQLQVEFSF